MHVKLRRAWIRRHLRMTDDGAARVWMMARDRARTREIREQLERQRAARAAA